MSPRNYTIDRRGGVMKRGKPEHHEYKTHVHFYIPATRDGCHDARPACGYGSYHLEWSRNPSYVDCPACRKFLGLSSVLKDGERLVVEENRYHIVTEAKA